VSLRDYVLVVVLPLLALATLLAAARLLRGPSAPDRILALELLTTLGIGIAAAWAVASGSAAFLDVALAVALVGFLGTVALAQYVERRG
jgi:multicomponent Na+:H+ antiporter subunit F